MDLILWRHATAEDGEPDHLRNLTERGRKDAELMAGWLRRHLSEGRTQVLSSPTNRTRQTVQALTDDYQVSEALGPGASAAAVLEATGWPERGGTSIVVGHNPWISELAALVCTGRDDRWAMRKGALWWFTSRAAGGGRSQVLVKAVMSPELLR
jgi:phosphohistidine phosphatase